jgi:hypothetical protein
MLPVILSLPQITSDELSHISIVAAVNVLAYIFEEVDAAIISGLGVRIVPDNMDAQVRWCITIRHRSAVLI